MRSKVHNDKGEVTKRVVRHGGHVVVQTRQPDGSWWNIRVMTFGQARAEGLYVWERDGR